MEGRVREKEKMEGRMRRGLTGLEREQIVQRVMSKGSLRQILSFEY